MKKRTPLGPYRRPMPRVLGGSQGVGRFLMREVFLKINSSTNRGSVQDAGRRVEGTSEIVHLLPTERERACIRVTQPSQTSLILRYKFRK